MTASSPTIWYSQPCSASGFQSVWITIVSGHTPDRTTGRSAAAGRGLGSAGGLAGRRRRLGRHRRLGGRGGLRGGRGLGGRGGRLRGRRLRRLGGGVRQAGGRQGGNAGHRDGQQPSCSSGFHDVSLLCGQVVGGQVVWAGSCHFPMASFCSQPNRKNTVMPRSDDRSSAPYVYVNWLRDRYSSMRTPMPLLTEAVEQLTDHGADHRQSGGDPVAGEHRGRARRAAGACASGSAATRP